MPAKGSSGGQSGKHLQELDELAALLNRHGITEFEWENKDEKVRIQIGPRFAAAAAPVMHAAPAVAHA